jgi:CHASE2 domain-containing sensor protein
MTIESTGEAAKHVATAIKDPMSYPLSQYGFVLAVSLLGGIVGWFNKVRKGELQGSDLRVLMGELTTSALAGLLTFWICEWSGVSPLLTAAMAGVAGHMGTRGIVLLEGLYERWAQRNLP